MPKFTAFPLFLPSCIFVGCGWSFPRFPKWSHPSPTLVGPLGLGREIISMPLPGLQCLCLCLCCGGNSHMKSAICCSRGQIVFLRVSSVPLSALSQGLLCPVPISSLFLPREISPAQSLWKALERCARRTHRWMYDWVLSQLPSVSGIQLQAQRSFEPPSEGDMEPPLQSLVSLLGQRSVKMIRSRPGCDSSLLTDHSP